MALHRDPSDENRTCLRSRYFFTFDPLEPGKTGIERKTVYLPGIFGKHERTSGALASWQRPRLARRQMDDGDLSWPLPGETRRASRLAWR